MKISKKWFLFLCVVIITCSLSSSAMAYDNSDEYILNSYHIDVKVNENNVLDITERIGAYFKIQKHGIFRKIPEKNNVVRLDGTKSQNRARITDIAVNEKYSLSKENGYSVIKIGDANRTFSGQKDYTISYSYNLGKDTGKGYDELYLNLIGDEWDTSINNVTFEITMPKEFDESKLGFSSGKKGSTESSNISYYVEENVISGKLNGKLNSGEALTIRLELPEGYFVNAGHKPTLGLYLFFVIPITALVMALLLWYLYGKDDNVVEKVEFYPPEGFNSLEIGYLYNGKASGKDVTSLLIYLANKGYLRINEREGNLSASNRFEIQKLKEYDGDNECEYLFFEGLFDQRKRVTAYMLQDKFYRVQEKILMKINSKANMKQIFEASTLSKSLIILMGIFISLITVLAVPTLEYAGIEAMGTTILVALVYTPFYAAGFLAKMSLVGRIFLLSFVIFHSSMFFSTLPIATAIKEDSLYLGGVLLGLACIIGMIICFIKMPKRTRAGNEILGRIRGFKTFLEKAEKEQLEMMVMQDPTYFYDILPYTYVLGVSDKWISKFEVINMQSPEWYGSSSDFNMHHFGGFISVTMRSAQNVMSSSPSSSGSDSAGGGSSGGGSSGGGSGGGGGGSW